MEENTVINEEENINDVNVQELRNCNEEEEN